MNLRRAWLQFLAALMVSSAAQAHPHVFVDGRVDFVFDENSVLSGIEVTWLYDAFETLYVLSTLEIDPAPDLALTSAQYDQLVAYESSWAGTFNGAARLSLGGYPILLDRPEGFAVRLVNNRLETTFFRNLTQPIDINDQTVEVTFYEETYFFAFTIAQVPRFLGSETDCSSVVEVFDPNSESEAIREELLRLGREETPEESNIGFLFTDRIFLTCV